MVGQGHKVVLVVDNKPAELARLREPLAYSGFQSITVATGEGAIKKLAERAYDLVLLEVDLSDTDGLDVVTFIRQDPRLYRIPVVAMSAFAHTKDRCLSGGCDYFLQKPIKILDLITVARKSTQAPASHAHESPPSR